MEGKSIQSNIIPMHSVTSYVNCFAVLYSQVHSCKFSPSLKTVHASRSNGRRRRTGRGRRTACIHGGCNASSIYQPRSLRDVSLKSSVSQRDRVTKHYRSACQLPSGVFNWRFGRARGRPDERRCEGPTSSTMMRSTEAKRTED